MIELIHSLEQYFNAKAVILDISCMDEIKKLVEELNQKDGLNEQQKFLTSKFYEFELPEVDFTIRSLLLFSFQFPARTMAGFTVNGQVRMFPVCLENIAHYRKITKQLGDVLQEKGFHASFIPKIPRKMIAVKSGLAKYGRNNIAYVEGQGSFISLLPFYTDIPTDNKTLYPIERMKSCSKCTLCAKLCPNQAIILDRELIDTERCLTYFNEEDSNKVTFPDWINPNVHNSVIGCEICQINCPQNKLYLHNETLAAIFDEEETNRLLQGVSYEELEGNIKRKVDVLNLDYLLSALPRNLKALFHD